MKTDREQRLERALWSCVERARSPHPAWPVVDAAILEAIEHTALTALEPSP